MSGKTTVVEADKVAEFQVNAATYGVVVPIILGTTRISGNVIDWYNFNAVRHEDTQRTGKGGGSKTVNVSYSYQAAVLIGLCEGPVAGVGSVWVGSDTVASLADTGLTLFNGALGQEPWPYTVAQNPAHALPYSGLAYVAGYIDLDSSGGLQNYNFEVKGLLLAGGDGTDCNPADLVSYICTDPINGIGLSPDNLDSASLDRFRTYCRAADLLVSLPLTDQSKVYEIINSLCEATNTIAFWSQSKLKFIPRCDEAITGNGAAYQPDTTPLYDLDEDDFLSDDDGKLVTFERSNNAETYNQATVEYINRANSYETESVDYQILADINKRGLRPMSTLSYHFFHTKARAEYAAQAAAMRSFFGRNTYQFKLGWSHCLLEPGDIVTLTDGTLGLDKLPVIIESFEESEDEEGFEVEALPLTAGVYSPAKYATYEAERAAIDYRVAPGDINDPAIFDAPPEIADSGLETWIAVSGGAHWGGCYVWLSEDGNTYKQIGTIQGPARHGTLTADLPAGSALDTAHTLAVALSGGGQLLSGSQEDAEHLNTLCWVDGELVAYQAATLTGPGQYALTYLVRGARNTAITSHAAGSQFIRLDGEVFKYGFTKDQLGRTVYLKFTSFNVYGVSAQSLDEVPAYTHTLTTQAPPDVSGIALDENTYILKDGTVLSDIIVRFTEPDYLILDHYNVYYDVNNGGAWQFAGTASGSSYTIKALPNTKAVKVKVCTVNKSGIESPGALSASYAITGKSDPPSDVAGLTVAQDEYNRANIFLSWKAATDPDIKGYEVRLGPGDWETAVKLNTVGPVVDTSFSHTVSENGYYRFLVKAIDNSGNYSNYAAVTGMQATVVPDAPTGVVATPKPTDASQLVLSWTASAGKDIAGYEIRLGTLWDTAAFITVEKNTSYTWTIPKSWSYNLMLRALTTAGKYSAIINVPVTVTIEPSDVSGFTATQSTADRTKVTLMWGMPSALDVAYFVIKKGSSWDGGEVIGQRVTGTFYDVIVLEETEQTFWIKAVNVAGKESQNPADLAGIFSLDPSPVTNIQLSQNVNDRSILNISWEATPESDLAYYEVRAGYVWESAVLVAQTKELNCTYSPETSGDVKIMVKARNAAKYFSDEASGSLEVKLEPSDVSGFRVFQNGEQLAFVWDKVPDNDVVDYELREGGSFENGTVIATGITLTGYQLLVDTEITRRFHIKAINSSGHYSLGAASASITITDLPVKNVIKTYDEIALQSGTHAGTAFGQSSITFATLPGDFPDYPTTKFSDIGGAVVLKLAKSGGIYPSSGTYTCTRKDVGQVITANIATVFQPSILYTAGTTASLEYRTSRDGTSWTDWQPFSPVEVTFRYVDFRVVLATADASATPEVNQLLIRIDVPDKDIAKTVTIPAGGATVQYGYTFYDLPVVTPTAEGATTRAAWSNKTKSSVFLQVLNTSTGADVGGKVDLRVKGY